MYLSLCTDVLGELSFTQMLDKVKSMGIDAVEMTAGGWGGCRHVPTEELLTDDSKLKAYKKELTARNMRIAALNCSGNQLWPTETGSFYSKSMYSTAVLAGRLGVKKLVMMSGLPAGAPGDKTPNWITSTVSWPDYMVETVRYQWEDIAVPWWKNFTEHCKNNGIEQIAIEEFPCQLVYNAETLWKLRNAVDPIIGMNLDPSHLIVMGADPIATARALKGALYHVHGKDARIERGLCDINGLPESKPVTESANRSWNYVAVGCGKDLQWWKEFFSVVRMMGYNDAVSLEMEDLTMSVEAGLHSSIDALNQTISK
ncbi:sugar phosphate isomerase/epimerase family protein [Pectinatus haikarae]|uniref:Sugar phosphate isomerase/epimerase n=1 Tax=Pectinatus haikarae TaxID=349096 RepID=A0ABT9YAN3_9FIRM|nr:sugar phosphate isomerase/epimerase [Pectinatus haikarae]MDQ0204164.1 sugar phosphate isomerase/epimerase [Pectinatus haikarae]